MKGLPIGGEGGFGDGRERRRSRSEAAADALYGAVGLGVTVVAHVFCVFGIE